MFLAKSVDLMIDLRSWKTKSQSQSQKFLFWKEIYVAYQNTLTAIHDQLIC